MGCVGEGGEAQTWDLEVQLPENIRQGPTDDAHGTAWEKVLVLAVLSTLIPAPKMTVRDRGLQWVRLQCPH